MLQKNLNFKKHCQQTQAKADWSSVQFSSVYSHKHEKIKYNNNKYKSIKSIFAHEEDIEKTKRSSKSAATALIKFESNHIHK